MPFPKVITRVIDKSQVPVSFSRFRAGLVGIAQKGDFDTVVKVPSIYEFVNRFGYPLPDTHLGDAVALIAGSSDGCRVVRVGAQYEDVIQFDSSGTSGAYSIKTPDASLLIPGDYIRIKQPSKKTTTNARIDTIVGTTVNLISVGGEAMALADGYTGATISSSPVPNAANSAESFLTSPVYGAVVSSAGTVIGDKNSYSLQLTSTAGFAVGDIIKIEQAGRASTREARVSQIKPGNRLILDNVNQTRIGFQALALQDSYTAATISKVVDQVGSLALQLEAASPGTWANTQGSLLGITVKVSPGSKADTKKLQVYDGPTLVETIDSLSWDTDSDNFYPLRINGESSFLTVAYVFGDEPPGNTYEPWDLTAGTRSNIAEFTGGFNGENVTDDSYVGTINPADDTPTGLKVFQDPQSVDSDVDFLCVPDATSVVVFQEMARIASLINAVAIGHVPDMLNAREAIDWHNGEGLYGANGRVDNYRVALFWNWFQIADTFDGTLKFVPPSLGYLRAAARTFDLQKPWYAVAGDVRGVIPEATAVRYRYVSQDVKDAMYGDGNSVNALLLLGNTAEIYGDRTMQRAESKLTALHTVVLINNILKGFSRISRRYTFEPIDDILYSQLRLECSSFLDAVKADRGLEGYALTIDASNNLPANRNARQVIIDLAIIPTDVVETFIITATVNSSGAVLTNSSVQSSS